MRITQRNLLIIALAIALASTPLYITIDYVQNNPSFCGSCHLMKEPYERWRLSAMHTVTCHKCHEQNVGESLYLLYQAVFVNTQNISRHAVVKPDVCLKCHGNGDIQYIQVLNESGHLVHFVENDIQCTNCHGIELHVFRPSKDLCYKCHDVKIFDEKMQFHCLSCHRYTEKDSKLRPDRSDCLICHTGRKITTVSLSNNAHQESDCSTCHKPHIEGEIVVSCNECHEPPAAGLHQVEAHTDCSSCHIPHTIELDVRDICTTCHEDRSTHMSPMPCNQCHRFTKEGE